MDGPVNVAIGGKMETTTINILLIEDNADDAFLIKRYLADTPTVTYNIIHVENLSDGLASLERVVFGVILLDLGLPDGGGGITTFESISARASRIPIIVLTGNDDDALAVHAVQKGAQDYLVKGRFDGALLSRSIRYAIERMKLLIELEQSMMEIKQLRLFLPICMHCKKIRDDKGYWTQVEVYISRHSDAKFSHGLCPECARTLYPDLYPKDGGS